MSEPTPSEALPRWVFLSAASPSRTQSLDQTAAAQGDALAGPPSVPGYEILGRLGEGGMGTVYLAHQLAVGRTVALKAIKASRRDNADAVARFRAEARRVAGLQHPHIIPIHEVGEAGGVPFFTMDYCLGGSLDRKLAGAPLPPREAAALVEKLARAVQAAHDHGVIHRDLKPANVLLTADGEPQVTDFGLARRLDDAPGPTLSHAVLGTPSYMAPEQTLGKAGAAGALADVYALGAILYECLTGRPPFKGPTALDTLLLVRAEEPAAPSQLQPKTPRDLETICLKCLRKEARRRYVSAAALAEDLRRFQAGEPIAARPAGTVERLRKWARRRPAVAALLAGLLAALAAGAAASTYFAVQAGRWAHDAGTGAAVAHDREREARAKEKEAQTRDAEAEQARRGAEAATARSILRPLKLQGGPSLDDAETDAVWELAESRSDAVRVEVIAQALRRPASARQLMKRMPIILNAAVGLDADRRLRVQNTLLDVVRDRQADPEVRCDCVQIAVALEKRTFAVGGVTFVFDLGDAGAGEGLSWTSPEFARQAGLAMADVAARAPGRPGPPVYIPGPALRALSARLDHDGAATVAPALADAMTHTTDAGQLVSLAQGLAGALDHLSPEERIAPARSAARALADAMQAAGARARALADPAPKFGDLTPRDHAASALATVARGLHLMLTRLPAQEAAGPARDAARVLTDAMPAAVAQKTDFQATANLSFGLRDVADGLDSAGAADAFRTLTELAGQVTSLDHSDRVGDALDAVAARLDRTAAADAAAALSGAMKKDANPYLLGAVAQGLGGALGRLPPDEAAPQATAAARLLIDAMAKDTDYSDPNVNFRPLNDASPGMALAKGFEAVTQRLDAADRDALMRTLADALNKAGNPAVVSRLLRALPAVAARLNADDRAGVDVLLVVVACKTTDQYTLDQTRRELSLYQRMDPAHAAAAARAMADTIAHAHTAWSLPGVTAEAPRLARQLDHDGAAAVAAELAERIARALPPDSPGGLAPPIEPLYQAGGLAVELGPLLGRLPPDEAAALARRVAQPLSDALMKTADAGASNALTTGLASVLARLPREEAAPMAKIAGVARVDFLLKPAALQNWWEIAPGLGALGVCMDHDGAAAVTRILADGMVKNPTGAANLGGVLSIFCGQLDHDAAAGAADSLNEALAKGPDASAAAPLKNALNVLLQRRGRDPNPANDGGKPNPADDPRQLADQLARGDTPNGIALVEQRLAASLDRLDHDGTAAAAQKLADALVKQTNFTILEVQTQALGDVLDRLPPDEAARVARKVAMMLVTAPHKDRGGTPLYEDWVARTLMAATARTNGTNGRHDALGRILTAAHAAAPVGLGSSPLTAAPLLALEGELPHSRLQAQDLVDVLKQPTCTGMTRDVVLLELGGLCGRRFGSVWDFVDWAETNRPDLDLQSPPRRE